MCLFVNADNRTFAPFGELSHAVQLKKIILFCFFCPQANGVDTYVLEIDLLETNCHVMDPTPVANCTVRPKISTVSLRTNASQNRPDLMMMIIIHNINECE